MTSLRRRSRIAIGAGVALVVVTGLATAVFQYGLPWWMDAGDRNHVYTSEVGRQRYQVHLPPQYDGETPLPVIMPSMDAG